VTLEEKARALATQAKDLARAGRHEIDVADIVAIVEPLARDFALVVLRKAEEKRGLRLTALEKATIIDLAAGE